LEIIFLA
jgi:hypothetical protein